jgi:Thioredoxin
MAQALIPMDAKRFATGLSWKDYMAQMGDTRARTESNYEKTKLTDEERKFFNGVKGVKYVIMTVENWCGDVHRNSPLVAHIADAIPGCELRCFLRDQNPDIRDAVLNNGYQSIPVAVFFDENWNEVGRWVERSHAATTKAAIIRSQTLDAVSPSADQAAKDAAMNEFRKQVQSAYEAPGAPLWRAAANEIKLLLESRAKK